MKVLFEKTGHKIKVISEVVFVLDVIACIIFTIILHDEMYYAALIFFCGPLVAWIINLIIYGFGEIIENSSIIAKSCNESPSSFPNARSNMNMPQNSRPVNNNQNFVQIPNDIRLQNLENLHAKKLITEKEYKRKVDSINFEQRNDR